MRQILDGLSTLANPRSSRKVLVVGTFRSGTNIAQHCFETFFHATPVFNEWFWKHGVPPSGIQVQVPSYVPIVVMSRDPVSFNLSLYKFWLARRPELDAGKNISDFIRRRLFVYDNTDGLIRPKYSFSSPTEYWNQFYFSWLNWKQVEDQRIFLRLEDLMADPATELNALADRFGLRKRRNATIALSEKRLGPNIPLSIREQDDRLSDEDVTWIRHRVDQDTAKSLGYNEILEPTAQRKITG